MSTGAGVFEANVAHAGDVVVEDDFQRTEVRHVHKPSVFQPRGFAVEEKQNGEAAEDEHAHRPADHPE